MTKPIGNEALMQNPALEPFRPFIGEWQTTGTHPMIPDTVFHGRTSFTWHEGGAFVIMRTEIDESEVPSGVAIFGSSDTTKTYFMLYFDERGVSRKYDVNITENQLSWERNDPDFAQRNVITIDQGGNTMTAHGEMSRDGATWEGDLSLNYARV